MRLQRLADSLHTTRYALLAMQQSTRDDVTYYRHRLAIVYAIISAVSFKGRSVSLFDTLCIGNGYMWSIHCSDAKPLRAPGWNTFFYTVAEQYNNLLWSLR
jgi:hypothetical protein